MFLKTLVIYLFYISQITISQCSSNSTKRHFILQRARESLNERRADKPPNHSEINDNERDISDEGKVALEFFVRNLFKEMGMNPIDPSKLTKKVDKPKKQPNPPTPEEKKTDVKQKPIKDDPKLQTIIQNKNIFVSIGEKCYSFYLSICNWVRNILFY
ncbi:hypothetical protein TUBRATIS_14060 [Tubulinosema ratisbonensis]|uniref:Uncharacterized protein n=1 Tax=Tubulinosema ratisbonensis TaxID=291195 RepID=A0A437AM89_9MICR|nr:hypothetical protein TUBRATIS_14060 [Tubulinosema ratisbonensis]